MSVGSERSPYWRLSGWPLVLFFLAVLVLVGSLRWYAARNDLAGDLVSMAGIVGANASAALVFDDDKVAAEILESLEHYPTVTDAALLRADGTVLAVYRARSAAASKTPSPAGTAEGRTFSLFDVEVVRPVRLHDMVVGHVAIRASQNRLYVQLARFVSGFLVIGLVAFVLTRLATDKLRRRTLQSEVGRRAAEDARRESERRLRSVTDHLPVVLFQLTVDPHSAFGFGYISDGAAGLLGIAPSQMIRTSDRFFARIHADDLRALQDELRQAPDVLPMLLWQGRYRRGPDDEIWIEIRGTRDKDEAGSIIVSGVILDVTQLRRYQQEIEQSRARLRDLIVHRENVVDEVHRKVAIEIHDQLGQIITAALLHLRLLDRALTPGDDAARELVQSIDDLLNEAYRSMKDIAVSLRPAVLNFGFVAAAEWLAERILGIAGVAWQITTSEPPPRLDERQSLAFFRIIQESLTNCVRHAEASEVHISLAATEGALVLEVADNGRGTHADAGGMKGLGLLGIRERAESLGGTATIHCPPSGGTTVTVTVPSVAP